MFRFAWPPLAAALIALVPPCAHAQHLSAEQLDRLSQERQKEIGPRDWGSPPSGQGGGVQETRPVPTPVRCMSPREDFEPLYAEPRASSRQIGTAAPQIAVTDEVRDGWRKVLRRGTVYAWIPQSDVVPYRPLVAGSRTRCEVAGEAADGMVLFTHPAP